MLHMYTYISISKLLGPPNEASHKLFKLRSLADLYPTSRRHDTEAMEPVNFMGMVDCRGPIKNSKSEKTHSKIQQLCSFRNEMKANKHAKTSPLPEGDLWTGEINQYTEDPIALRIQTANKLRT